MNSKGRLKLLFLFSLIFNLVPFIDSTIEQNETSGSNGDVLHGSVVRELEKKLYKDFVEKFMKRRNRTLTQEELEEQLTLISEPNPPTDRPDEIGPPLECAYYNHDDCEANGNCEVTKETCYPESHLKGAGCYAVFNFPPVIEENSTEKYIPVHRSQYQKLGCIQFQDPEMMGCAHDTICRQTQTVKTVGHCCCGTANCNGQGLEQLNPVMMNKGTSASSLQSTPSSELGELTFLGGIPIYGIFTGVLIVLFIAACFVIAFFGYRYNKKKEEAKRKKFDMEKTNAMENGNLPLVAEEPPIEMVETPKELPITDFLLISQGRFGTVHRAKWTENGEEYLVAVKKVAESQLKTYEAEKEIFEFFQSLPTQYSAIVGFNCAEKIGNEYWIVTHFQERLSLYELLKHNEISITSCGRLLLSMLDGLQFLHDDRPYFAGYSKKPIIHRDIKSKNILVKRDMTACIADFGLARIFEFEKIHGDLSAQVGTKRYMSPEILEGAVEFTAAGFKAIDVYSMALVMWETISRTALSRTDTVPEYKVPYDELGFDPKMNVIREHVGKKGERPAWRDEVKMNEHTEKFSAVTEQMWDRESAARITAGCAFNLIWTHIMRSQLSSEGYHTENSEESTKLTRMEEESSFHLDPAGTEKMSIYHSNYKFPHPSPDPELDNCPPVPPLPIITDKGITHPKSTINGSEEKQVEHSLDEDDDDKELIFSVAHGRYITRQEKELMDAESSDDSFNLVGFI